MKRMLWLGIGLAIGALTVRVVTRKARALTPGGLADSARRSAGGLVDSVRSFVADVREGMADREDQLHTAFIEGTPIDDEGPGMDGHVQEGKHSR